MIVQIDIPDNVFSDAARRALNESFRMPQYNETKGGEAYEIVKREIYEHVRSDAATEMIRNCANRLFGSVMEPVVKECAETAVRKIAKKIIQEEMVERTLFTHKP